MGQRFSESVGWWVGGSVGLSVGALTGRSVELLVSWSVGNQFLARR